MNIGLLILRATVGLTLAAHGSQKLFGWFGGGGLARTGAFLESLGFVPGRRAALRVGLAEFGGGLLLALGALTPLAAAAIIAAMTVAIVSVHLKHGFFATHGGFEFPLVLALVSLSQAVSGPGALSLDALAGLHWTGVHRGLVVLVVGLAGAAIELARRRRAAAHTPAKAA